MTARGLLRRVGEIVGEAGGTLLQFRADRHPRVTAQFNNQTTGEKIIIKFKIQAKPTDAGFEQSVRDAIEIQLKEAQR